jgi:hypothetical protein
MFLYRGCPGKWWRWALASLCFANQRDDLVEVIMSDKPDNGGMNVGRR